MASTREEMLTELKQRLGDRIGEVTQKNARRYYAEAQPADIPEVTRTILRDMGARFQIASGVDTPGAIEILYHWAFDSLDCVVTVVTKLDRDKPEIDSCAGIFKGIEWIEREIWELLGVTFKGHPDMRHLLLLDDWPEGKCPLRRDYKGLDH